MDEGDWDMNGGAGAGNRDVARVGGQDEGDRQGQTGNYSFGSSGSGGFGFGPGAEEDEETEDVSSKEGELRNIKLRLWLELMSLAHYPSLALYPSLTPHPHPHHITNKIPFSSTLGFGGKRSTSPLSVQPFSSGLRGPATNSALATGARSGVFQPTISAPLGANATEVERARAVHGPQCKSIPKLKMSDYPDPATGERSMWTVCGDCGSCERAM